MPDSKDNTKLTGDTHPPEVEDSLESGRPQGMPDALGADGTPRDRGQGRTPDGKAARTDGDSKTAATTSKSGESRTRDEPDR